LDHPKIIIFTALQIETKAVKRALSDKTGQCTQIHTIGILARHIPLDFEKGEAIAVIMAGLTGALDPALAIGDVVIDDPQLRLPPSLALRRGPILTTDRIIGTPTEKAELFRQSGALAVDMEGEKVRQFATGLGIPYVGVRAISDTAGEALDPAVVGFVDDFGRVKPMSLASGVLRQPGLIPYLNRLGKNSRFAAERLGLAVRQIVECLVVG
jgi:adenosylhomocysteine nucleosidase